MTDYAKKGKWSPIEEDRLDRIFSDKSNEEIAELMGRPVSSVATAARRLGLKKSPAYLARLNEQRSLAAQKQGAKADENIDDVVDYGKGVFVRPSPGPGWGPITVHRISAL
jgi:hypothetical protein